MTTNKELLKTKAIVSVANNKVRFVHLTIEQSYGEHHSFAIYLDYEELQDMPMSSPVSILELIGKKVYIELQPGNDNGKAYIFNGIITEAIPCMENGRQGQILLRGSSPTIMLEQGRRMEIYSGMTVRQIFKQVLSRTHDMYIDTAGTPTFKGEIAFLMQYNESDWQFLQRLAYMYGENLFFSGSQLLFGEYKEWQPVDLYYNADISFLQFGSRLLPNTFTRYNYQAFRDETLEKQTSSSIENSNEYLDAASKRSVDLTEKRQPKMPLDMNVNGQAELDELVKREKTRTAASTVFISGISDSYRATIGRLITVKLNKNISSRNELGTFRVIKSIHKIDQIGNYTNEFEAVPSQLKVMPMPEIPMPVAGSMPAKVRDNADPDGKGRVLVDFPFTNNRNEYWMRVMSPHAGSSNEVERGRGMVFIPEKGDQVMIDFEMGNPNMPYVSGSMFHGNNAFNTGAENYVKSIISRMGLTLELNDNPSSPGITLKDTKGNLIYIDTKASKIEVTALETLAFNAKDIEINASNNVIIQADASIKADAMADVHIGAQTNIDIASENTLQFKSIGATDIEAKSDMKLSGTTTTLTGLSKTEVAGRQTTIKGEVTTVSGSANKIEVI